MTIAIVDYGVGNLQSLKKAFAYFGVTTSIEEDAAQIEKADALVLPGVGSFEAGMRGLHVRHLAGTVKSFSEAGKPILGICLGAQLLLDEGHEFGIHKGLGIISGNVVRFPEFPQKEKVPHVGWNGVRQPSTVSWTGSILQGLGDEPEFYFVHSYILVPDATEHILGRTTYGGVEFCSVIKKGNTIGVQFHPEKSGKIGLALIKNYIDLVERNAE